MKMPKTCLAPRAKLAAAAIAAGITLAVLAGIVALFTSDGVPFADAMVAERACAEYAFASERGQCMQSFVASAHRHVFAGR